MEPFITFNCPASLGFMLLEDELSGSFCEIGDPLNVEQKGI